jgi:3-hydroxyacyl-[acyl-carrier-protein] dehydratase
LEKRLFSGGQTGRSVQTTVSSVRPWLFATEFGAKESGVPKKPLIIDFSAYDLNNVVADLEAIRRFNPQRYEMEQLTAICYENREDNTCVGYKDLTDNEFWTRGHMPGMPLMPGVIMCEAAAQLASYYSHRFKLMDAGIVGFGGLEEVRFRGVVRPGDRFVIVCRLLKLRRSIMTCEFECFVDQNLVCEGILKGVALPVNQIANAASQAASDSAE